MRRIIMITGGARSGKSRRAEELALSLSPCPVYLATAHVWDEEFRQRVALHQARRGSEWTNLEEEIHLSRHNLTGRVVVVDCVTLWLTNIFFNAAGHGQPSDTPEKALQTSDDTPPEGGRLPDVDVALAFAKDEFARLTAQEATFIFVTNEIGSGGTSTNALQRRFTDLQGWMNQHVARQADEVVLMVSGLAVKIK